jgi:hypothetical protein
MRLPQRNFHIDESRAISQLRYAADHGVNYFDTALPYHGGESENLVGKFLQDSYRGQVKLATKLPAWVLNKPEDMDAVLDMQLRKLKTDHIDYYLLHGLEEAGWRKLQSFGVLKFLDKAKANGKIVNTGFSFHGTRLLFREIVDSYDWVMCQMQYNYLDEYLQAGTEGLKYAASRNLAVMIMEPLRGGLLANKVPQKVKQMFAKADASRKPAEWGLRWVWNHPEVTVVLSGMNDEKQVEENIATAETALPNSLSSKDLVAIKEVADEYHRSTKVPCTGCGYCMPCPNGVDIPGNFAIYNQYYMLPGKLQTRGMYAMHMGAMDGRRSDASLCKDCGACEKRCPQHIGIPNELKQVKGTLGGLRTKALIPIIRRMVPRAKVEKDD